MINGVIQGQELVQYDLTPQQYQALIRLTATICRVLPKVRCDYPKDEHGELIASKLPDGQLAAYSGLIGHYHIQDNKTDPGPAFDWEYVTREARQLLPRGSGAARHEPVATGAGE
jgi:N-acetyl-anhydromuramyl-L-alanine amidase AmpD